MRTTNILERIIAEKHREIALRKENIPVRILESSRFFEQPCNPFADALKATGKSGIIAEFKRRSPSLGWINENADVATVVNGYSNAGASALSILTDEKFFGGSLSDIAKGRIPGIPILRKDFIIDEYQLIETKAAGADVVLLIAACLSSKAVRRLAVFARQLGLNVLLELHGEEELDMVCDEVDVVGINNRNLKNFEVDLENSIKLASRLQGHVLVAESGIKNLKTVELLREQGFSGFLIGERFMKSKDPAEAFKSFLNGKED